MLSLILTIGVVGQCAGGQCAMPSQGFGARLFGRQAVQYQYTQPPQQMQQIQYAQPVTRYVPQYVYVQSPEKSTPQPRKAAALSAVSAVADFSGNLVTVNGEQISETEFIAFLRTAKKLNVNVNFTKEIHPDLVGQISPMAKTTVEVTKREMFSSM